MRLTRRGLLIGTGVGGALIVAYAVMPRRFPLPLAPGPDETAFNNWIKIARDGRVSVAVPQCEMGQGITTLLPQIVAVELGADWRRVAAEPAPVSGGYANAALAARWAPLWAPAWLAPDEADDWLARDWAERHRFMVTAEGTSIDAYEQPAREAAAGARALLAQAAAARWDVGWEECTAAGGRVRHRARSLGFGELASEAARFDLPEPLPLRSLAREPPAMFPPQVPPRFPRLDAPAKAKGMIAFAGDIRLPGMVYAAIAHGPVGDAELARFGKAAIAGTADVIGIVQSKRWLAAVADSWWSADQAVRALAPTFRMKGAGADSAMNEAAIEHALRRGEAERLVEVGDPDPALARPDLALRFAVGAAQHATLETATATARLSPGRLELWLPTQAPEAARRAAGEAVGLPPEAVVLYPVPAGGSFDLRLDNEVAVEAALIAREIRRPVQLIYSRHQQALRGWPRPAAAAHLSASLGPDGMPRAWKTRIAVPSAGRELGRRLIGGDGPLKAMRDSAQESDPFASEGAVPPYAIPNLTVERVACKTSLPSGRMRGGAHGYTAFFTECFIDELARKAMAEPLSYRIAMLGHDLRLAECLTRVAALAQWDGGLEASGQGLACHRMGSVESGGAIAVIATARRSEDGGIRVGRIAAVADIGRILNIDIARQQIEGGLLFGLGMAAGASTGYSRGMPKTSRLSALSLPLLADAPHIDVALVDSAAPPFDPGEIGVAAVAPAIANALFSATGLRLRSLPLLGDAV